VDYFANSASGFAPNSFSHFREGGWNVLFTDGSVQFSQNVQAFNLIQTFSVAESSQSQEQEDFILNYLELDH
jgi:prepilin-type processing-associated H-X9-DG protein